MNVVNPNLPTHSINIIPRYYPSDLIILVLYNQATQQEENLGADYVLDNGILTFSFDFLFENNSKYQYKLIEDTEIVYRGKIIATTQETQNYLTDKDEYYYE